MTIPKGSAAMAFERRHAPKMKNRKRSGYRILSGKRFTRPWKIMRISPPGFQLEKPKLIRILPFFPGDK
jgi:hypothetical protein